jgi:hypothetical protein
MALDSAVVSIYSNHSLIEEIADILGPQASQLHFWALDDVHPRVARWTRGSGRGAKWNLLNQLLPACGTADLVLFTDDDVGFKPGFLRDMSEVMRELDFALAQPTLTIDSHHLLPHVLTRPGLIAREVNYTDVMVFAADRRFLSLATPFDARFAQIHGDWAVNRVWSDLMANAGLRAGLVDRVPVEHTFRPIAANYSMEASLLGGIRLLRQLGLETWPMMEERRVYRDDGTADARVMSAAARAFYEIVLDLDVRKHVSALIDRDRGLCDPRSISRLFTALAELQRVPDVGAQLGGVGSLPELLVPVERYVRGLLHMLEIGTPRAHANGPPARAADPRLQEIARLDGDALVRFLLEIYSLEVFWALSPHCYAFRQPPPRATS